MSTERTDPEHPDPERADPERSEGWRHVAALMGYDSTSGAVVEQVNELKRWIDFDAADHALLRGLLPAVRPRLEEIADHFYAAIKRSSQALAVFEDEAQARRLHSSLQRWIVSLLEGPWDESWAARSQHIGQVHVRVGLAERYMFAAMSLLRQDLCAVACDNLSHEEARRTCSALNKVTDLELCLMTGAYHQAREDKRMRSLQQLIIENLPVHVLVLDAKGNVSSATHRKGRIFDDAATVGLPYAAFLPPELVVAADLDTHIHKAIATGRVTVVPHVRLPGPPARHFRIGLVPLDHSMARLLLHVEELTDVLDAQARVHQAETLARIGGMAAQLAHEIRNPIAGISGTLQVIVANMDDDDRRRQILGRVQDQVHRLDRLVRDLLDYAKPTELTISQATLKALAAESALKAAVEVELDVVADHSLQTDPEAVHQVLVNLLQNARDATADDGWIGVQVGPGLELWVMDDGPGIPRDIHESLFDPFVSSKTRGTGLGLAICKRRAQELGGTLDLYDGPLDWPSDRRRGAVFRLRLPLPRNAATG